MIEYSLNNYFGFENSEDPYIKIFPKKLITPKDIASISHMDIGIMECIYNDTLCSCRDETYVSLADGDEFFHVDFNSDISDLFYIKSIQNNKNIYEYISLNDELSDKSPKSIQPIRYSICQSGKRTLLADKGRGRTLPIMQVTYDSDRIPFSCSFILGLDLEDDKGNKGFAPLSINLGEILDTCLPELATLSDEEYEKVYCKAVKEFMEEIIEPYKKANRQAVDELEKYNHQPFGASGYAFPIIIDGRVQYSIPKGYDFSKKYVS